MMVATDPLIMAALFDYAGVDRAARGRLRALKVRNDMENLEVTLEMKRLVFMRRLFIAHRIGFLDRYPTDTTILNLNQRADFSGGAVFHTSPRAA